MTRDRSAAAPPPLPTREFRTACEELERQMARLADADGDAFLPNPTPRGPVDFLLICMEPSLGRWARSREEARERVSGGFRNFLSSLEDFIVHYAARHYLCGDGQSYHITDISKGAMLVHQARGARAERYARWHALLQEEVRLLAKPGARVIMFGNEVEGHLRDHPLPVSVPVTKVVHYSGQAARARAEGVRGREATFERFAETISLDHIWRDAKEVLAHSGIPEPLQEQALAGLSQGNLSDSRKKLLFLYKLAFEALRSCS